MQAKVAKYEDESTLITLPHEILFLVFEYVDASTLYYSLPFVCKHFLSTLNTTYTEKSSLCASLDKRSRTFENLLWKNMSKHFFSNFTESHLFSFKKLYYLKYGIKKLPFMHHSWLANILAQVEGGYGQAKRTVQLAKDNLDFEQNLWDCRRQFSQILSNMDTLTKEYTPVPTSTDSDNGFAVYYFKGSKELSEDDNDAWFDSEECRYDNELKIVSTLNGNSIAFTIRAEDLGAYEETVLNITANLLNIHGKKKATTTIELEEDVWTIVEHLGMDKQDTEVVWEDLFPNMFASEYDFVAFGEHFEFDFEDALDQYDSEDDIPTEIIEID